MKIRTLLTYSLLLLSIGNAYAVTYDLPSMKGDTVIAQYPNEDSHLITVTREDYPEIPNTENVTLLDVAKRFDLGQEEVVRLNSSDLRWLVLPCQSCPDTHGGFQPPVNNKQSETVRIPNKRILPETPHNGVTLNISEFRMYYYPPNTGNVYSFPHGIGRQDWKTPLGQTRVQRKVKNPVWNPPESIRREHAAEGDPLPATVPAGPHNPLGTRALYLALPGEYRIHGTDVDKIYGIGMQITHGCVRMYPTDIEELYDLIAVGTPVYIVKQPIKVGWLNNVLYIEAHPDLEGENMGQERRYQVALELIRKRNGGELPEFDQKALNDALEKLDGEPVALYERLPPIDGGTVSVPDDMPVLPSTINTEPLTPETPLSSPEPVSKVTPKTDIKIAIKPAPKTNAKVAAKPTPKNSIKVAIKPAPKTNVKVVVKPVPKTNTKVAVKPVPKTNAKVAVKPVPKTTTKTKAVVKPETKSTPKTASKVTIKSPATISAVDYSPLALA
jgi:L,D-transpeptidase ErfK/SrfK